MTPHGGAAQGQLEYLKTSYQVGGYSGRRTGPLEDLSDRLIDLGVFMVMGSPGDL
jgi:hypothetical protein